MKPFLIAYLIVVAALSLVSFIVYGVDKRLAGQERRRVPEKTLHLLALLGGWPGAIAGQRIFRHKTQKLAFRMVFWIGVLLHLAVVIGIVYLLQSRG